MIICFLVSFAMNKVITYIWNYLSFSHHLNNLCNQIGCASYSSYCYDCSSFCAFFFSFSKYFFFYFHLSAFAVFYLLLLEIKIVYIVSYTIYITFYMAIKHFPKRLITLPCILSFVSNVKKKYNC